MHTTFAILLGLILFWGLFVPLFSYGLFVLHTSRRKDPLALRACEFGLARCAALGVAASLGCLTLMAVSYPLALIPGRRRPTPTPVTPGVPAILVHGLYHNASAWFPACLLMAGSGLGPVLTPSFDTFRGDFDAMAARLADLVLETSRRHGDAPVALMGHSLGGLLIKAISDDRRLQGRIRSIVTLGTPWRGSRLAAWAVGRVGRQLGENGRIVATAARHRVQEHVPRLCLYSPMDNMVMPTSSLLPPDDGWQVEETAFLPHLAMLYHLPTLKRAIAFLAQAQRRPSAAPGLAFGVEKLRA